MPEQGQTHRLAPRPGEAIDRSRTFEFTFEGKTYTAHPGDTIASALAAAGVGVLSRSFKYHRPRGLFCGAGHCPNCLVQIGDEPNVRSCQRPVEEGMAVRAQNVWPSLETDLLSLAEYLSPLMPVGFYYKTFMRPRALWPRYEDFLRRAAGLGVVDPHSRGEGFSKQFLHAEVAVVGGGPAGISAALAAAGQGARVLLFEEQPALGGHLRWAGRGPALVLPGLLQDLERQPRIQVFPGTMVTGWYADHWLVAVQGKRLYKIRAQAVVAATGAYEQPLLFAGNDLPGVMLGGGVLRLLRLYGVRPGQRAVVVADGDEGWEVALALREAGVELKAVVARGEDARAAGLEAAGVRVLRGYTVVEAMGDKRVRRAVLARVDGQGRAEPGSEQRVDCDLVALSGSGAPAADLAYMAGCRGAYDEAQAEFRFSEMRPGFYAAGRVNGMRGVEGQALDGRRAGLEAAAQLGLGAGLDTAMADELRRLRQAQSPRTTLPVPGLGAGKRFVCLCEDVTDIDVATAIAEGYESPELLKRYSTISMGPCQGKMCGMNALHLCARARGQGVGQAGRTTARPPVNPMSLGNLAGQHLEPVQLSPVHQWHLDRGARMMGAGLWLRPEHYGDAAAEVQAVRQRVGLIDVSTLGKLQFTGLGVPALLERLYVNQWRRLEVGRVRYGVMCNDEGVVIDDGVGARLGEEEWYMTTTSSGAAAVFELIQWWMQAGWGEGAHLTDLTEAFAAFNLAGPQSRAVLQQLTDTDLGNQAFPYMHARRAMVAGVPCRLLRLGFTGELSYEIHCPSGYGLHLWEALVEAGTQFGISPFGVEAQRVLRLEKAHIIIGQDTDALADAFSAGLEGLVKMDKPDFLGKRSLMRVAATGVQQRLAGFKMARPGIVPEEGLQIVERRQGKLEIIGWITSSRFSPTLGETIGLCWLPAVLAEGSGAEFTIFREGELLGAKVYRGAFYDPQGERVRG